MKLNVDFITTEPVHCRQLYLSLRRSNAHFPQFGCDEWQEASREIRRQEMPQPLEYHFVEYRRNQKTEDS